MEDALALCIGRSEGIGSGSGIGIALEVKRVEMIRESFKKKKWGYYFDISTTYAVTDER